MSDTDRAVRVKKLGDSDDLELFRTTTPAERVNMVWQLTLNAWAFKGEPITDPRLQRHVVHVIRGGD